MSAACRDESSLSTPPTIEMCHSPDPTDSLLSSTVRTAYNGPDAWGSGTSAGTSHGTAGALAEPTAFHGGPRISTKHLLGVAPPGDVPGRSGLRSVRHLYAIAQRSAYKGDGRTWLSARRATSLWRS